VFLRNRGERNCGCDANSPEARWENFPPRQKSASFNVDDVVEKIMDAAAKGPGR
jgi:hypothetical protein